MPTYDNIYGYYQPMAHICLMVPASAFVHLYNDNCQFSPSLAFMDYLSLLFTAQDPILLT